MIEVKQDYVAFSGAIGPYEYELMLALELGRWALPLGVDYSRTVGRAGRTTCVLTVAALRFLCTALYLTVDKTTANATADRETT